VTIKLTSDRAAAVNTSLPWLSVHDYPPPTGAKVLLINRAQGIAVLGHYKRGYWTHWQGLPHFADHDKPTPTDHRAA
jgi:hypothetical protein